MNLQACIPAKYLVCVCVGGGGGGGGGLVLAYSWSLLTLASTPMQSWPAVYGKAASALRAQHNRLVVS